MIKRSGAPSCGSVHRDRGSVTLEAALVLPVLLLLAVTLLWAMGVAFTALAMGDAVRTSARLIARGESADAVMTLLQESLPDSEVVLEPRDVDIVITAERFVSVPIPVLNGVGFTVTQSAAAPLEGVG